MNEDPQPRDYRFSNEQLRRLLPMVQDFKQANDRFLVEIKAVSERLGKAEKSLVKTFLNEDNMHGDLGASYSREVDFITNTATAAHLQEMDKALGDFIEQAAEYYTNMAIHLDNMKEVLQETHAPTARDTWVDSEISPKNQKAMQQLGACLDGMIAEEVLPIITALEQMRMDHPESTDKAYKKGITNAHWGYIGIAPTDSSKTALEMQRSMRGMIREVMNTATEHAKTNQAETGKALKLLSVLAPDTTKRGGSGQPGLPVLPY